MDRSTIQAWVMPLVMLGVWLCLGLLNAWNHRRMRRAPRARQTLAEDPRPPVVFLRPFDEDLPVDGPFGFQAYGWEEKLADVLQAVGPMVAIGRPGEELPPMGAGREYPADADWQDIVTGWMVDAALVVLIPGQGSGVRWELVRAFQFVDPQRIVVVLPPPRGLHLSGAQWRQAQQARYSRLRQVLDPQLSAPLPASPGRARFIVFDARRRPRLLLPPARWRSLVLGQRADSRAGLTVTLRPHLRAQGLRLSRRHTWLAAAMYFPFMGMLQAGLASLLLFSLLFFGVWAVYALGQLFIRG